VRPAIHNHEGETMLQVIASRRTLATAVIAAVASVGSVAGVSLAQGNDPAPTISTPVTSSPTPGGILADVRAVLTALVADGTINQNQADAV
jgi:hypothetical protein